MSERKNGILTPSGKAAENLNKRGLKASTYHRHLLCQWYGGGLNKVDNLVLEEASMINLWDLYFILDSAKKSETKRIILLGDPYQLPPVQNVGTLFHTLFRTPKFSRFRAELTTNFRSKEYNDLFVLGTQIREVMDETKQLSVDLFTGPNITFHLFDSKEELIALLHQQLDRIAINDSDSYSNHTRIITMKRTGMPLYENNYNQVNQTTWKILKRFNPSRQTTLYFEPGDLCMSKTNVCIQGSLVVCNGMQGRINNAVYSQKKKHYMRKGIHVEFDNYWYKNTTGTIETSWGEVLEQDKDLNKVETMLQNLEHGSFTTVHKFQGSEKEHIIAIGTSTGRPSDFYTLELLYTQLSRPRKSLAVLLQRNVFEKLQTNPGKPYYNSEFEAMLSEKINK